MKHPEFDSAELAEIDALADRAKMLTRRNLLKASGGLPFVIPALAVFAVPRDTLGQTGSNSGKGKGKGKEDGNGDGKGKEK
jgi:hypothetical protein